MVRQVTPRSRRQRARKKQLPLTVGMVVKATAADLGEHDVSQSHIVAIEADDRGQVADVVIEKGTIFRKEIVIPAERIIAVDTKPESADPGELTVVASEQEMESLAPTSAPEILDSLPDQVVAERAREKLDPVEAAQQAVPTVEGMRMLEERDERLDRPPVQGWRGWLNILGPGLLGGLSGNDASAVTSYAVTGATTGFSQLWLLVLATPILQSVLVAGAHIGRVTQQGLGEIIHRRYGNRVALPVALSLMGANIALIAGDLVAIGSGLELMTGLAWEWFVIPVAAFIWYVTVYQNFDAIKKVFFVLSLAFIAYLVTGFASGAPWMAVARATFIPSVSFSFGSIASMAALLGATISPYTIFWQVQGEKEEQRPGSLRQQLRYARIDIASGVLGGNSISYAIVLCTAATLYTHHRQITTAADAARSLQPLIGPFATWLFAIGLIGAGLVAIPVLMASTGYVVTGAFGWAASLWKKPWQHEGFYLILSVAMIASLLLALLRINPIQLMFWSNIIQVFLAPVLLLLIFLLGTDRHVLGKHRLGWLTLGGVGIGFVILIVSAILLIISLANGQAN